MHGCPALAEIDHSERHTFIETIYLPERKWKKLKVQKAARKSTRKKDSQQLGGNQYKNLKKTLAKPNPKPPSIQKPSLPKKTIEERLEARQAYDKARNQTPERKVYQNAHQKQLKAKKAALGLCRDFRQPPISGQTRCETCRDKHRATNRSRNTERRD